MIKQATKSVIEHEIELTIPFHDVDMMNVTWHGHYVRYLELARCAMLDSIDYGYTKMFESGYAWPVIDMRLRYAQGCGFGDKINIRARIVESEFRLKIDYLISKVDTGARITKASTVQVAVDMESGEMCYPAPPILAEKIAAASACI